MSSLARHKSSIPEVESHPNIRLYAPAPIRAYIVQRQICTFAVNKSTVPARLQSTRWTSEGLGSMGSPPKVSVWHGMILSCLELGMCVF